MDSGPGSGVNHSPYNVPRLKKEWIYTSTPTPNIHGLFQDEFFLLPSLSRPLLGKTGAWQKDLCQDNWSQAEI
jgi:hypothetical protein